MVVVMLVVVVFSREIGFDIFNSLCGMMPAMTPIFAISVSQSLRRSKRTTRRLTLS